MRDHFNDLSKAAPHVTRPPVLPIEDCLADLIAALGRTGRAVLQAPPGAGKTTRVPLAMLEAGLVTGRILMLEPRRLAARAAAERMAQTLGELVGQTVGYRVRGDAKTSAATRIEVVTEGILTRMIQDNPDLPGIGALIFDEFHERSLNADLGLALAWEVRGALRDDLIILVMSATLDAEPVAALLDAAPIITSQGRAYPVETRWLDRPPPKEMRFEFAMRDLILRALSDGPGGVLAFLPGEGEIRRVAAALEGQTDPSVQIHQLFGAMPLSAQRAALAPMGEGRKLVLATSIAETSLTIEGIQIVVDGGRARRSRFDPSSGMARLVTEPVSRAEADQRRGRAGRVTAGLCYRNWTKGQEGALPAFAPAEIEATDLASFALDLARWGTTDGAGMAFLTPPPLAQIAEARNLLTQLEALGPDGHITKHGRDLAKIPVHPRLAHMIRKGGRGAAELAALMSERDPLRGRSSDMTLRLRALRDPKGAGADMGAIARIRQEVKRLTPHQAGPALGPAAQAALAYPDRIGLRRAGDAPRYVLSGGKGAIFDLGDPLAGHRLIVATDLDGDPREARIRLALPLTEAQVRAVFADQISWQNICTWSRRERKVLARRHEKLGALILSDQRWDDAPAEMVTTALIEGIRDLGLEALNWSKTAIRLRARLAFSELVDVTDAALLATLPDWLGPYLGNTRNASDLKQVDLTAALTGWLGWDQMKRLDELAPATWQSPMGRQLAIAYEPSGPEVELRLQEVFGTTTHPRVGPDRLPLKMILLSPASRTVQVTTDLPGFWSGSYADVRKDMRARYPRHPWPEDPSVAEPTTRIKPRD
jgi:ATP-dependent helicase HrpB